MTWTSDFPSQGPRSIIGLLGGVCEGWACLRWVDESLPHPPPQACTAVASAVSAGLQVLRAKEARSTHSVQI